MPWRHTVDKPPVYCSAALHRSLNHLQRCYTLQNWFKKNTHIYTLFWPQKQNHTHTPPNHTTAVNHPVSYLLVHICPIVDQQLQTEGTVGGDGSQVQGGVATLVGLINISSVVHQLRGHCLLAHVAGHVECSVSKTIGLINLRCE